jgi:hypothetical protein
MAEETLKSINLGHNDLITGKIWITSLPFEEIYIWLLLDPFCIIRIKFKYENYNFICKINDINYEFR